MSRNLILITITYSLLILSTPICAAVANGIAFIKMTAQSSDQTAKAVLFVSQQQGNPYTTFDTGSGNFQTESATVAKTVLFDEIFSRDLVKPSDSADHSSLITTLTSVSKQYPLTNTTIAAVIQSLEAQMTTLEQGKVRFRGNWIARDEYESLATTSRSQTSTQVTDFETRMANASKSQTNISAQAILKNYPRIRTLLAPELHSSRVASSNFGSIGADLAKAASPIPRIRPELNSLLYTTAEADGPSAVWVTPNTNTNICAVAAACTLSLDKLSGVLLNPEQVKRYNDFISKYVPGLPDHIPAGIIASKTRKLLEGTPKNQSVAVTTTSIPSLEIGTKKVFFIHEETQGTGTHNSSLTIIAISY